MVNLREAVTQPQGSTAILGAAPTCDRPSDLQAPHPSHLSSPCQRPVWPIQLPRLLNATETWGFGLTGLLLWLGAAPGAHAELGVQAMLVWIPSAIVGMMLNLQVKHLGQQWPDVAGGTPNYITRILQDYPKLASYAVLGYYISWVAVLPVNAIILTDLIEANLTQVGLHCPETLLRMGLTTIAFITALSGTRGLGILHLFLVVPAVCLLLAFCLQGMGWLMLSPASPGLMPETWTSFDLTGWAKWYLIATYAVYACETASSFIADSRQPKETPRILGVAAGLIPIVYLGGSWVVMRLATAPGLGDNAFLTLQASAAPFWGNTAPFLVTFLIASGCLLSCATAVSNCPRILYQLALDGQISPVFTVVSPQGVLGPGLLLTFALSLLCLIWGNVSQIVMITGVGWLTSFIIFHGGSWLYRRRLSVRWPWWSLGFCLMELLVLLVGGIAWSWEDLLIGLSIPGLILLGDRLIQRFSIGWFQPDWWRNRYLQPAAVLLQDSIVLQVGILIILVSTAALVSWFLRSALDGAISVIQSNVLVVVILITAFVAVTVACWTSLPQVDAIQNLATSATLQAQELEVALENLKQTQSQLVQTEKMSSLGQLVAGIAHEINNPINFIHGNVNYAYQYIQDLVELLQLYQTELPQSPPAIQEKIEDIDLEFLLEDLPRILTSMQVGTDRIQGIVRSLRNFSRLDEAEMKAVDIHDGIESTLMILRNRLKAKGNEPEITVVKEYGSLPLIECYAGPLNQVFMNILANAIDALEEAFSVSSSPLAAQETSPQITITTAVVGEQAQIRIRDNGPGIPEAVQTQLFNPFFTTKPIGKGTGLGLSISQQIVTEKHQGSLQCLSAPGQGTEFIIQIPISATK